MAAEEVVSWTGSPTSNIIQNISKISDGPPLSTENIIRVTETTVPSKPLAQAFV